MLNKRVKHYFLPLFFLILNTSCFPIFSLKKIRAKANECCNFNPIQNKVTLRCGDKKIIFIRISIGSINPNISGETFYEANFNPPINETILPTLPDSIKQKRTISIDIWNTNQVIHDYRIKVIPENWKSEKLLFAKYSYR